MANIGLISHLQLEAGWLCLDFANTADWHASENPTEYLKSYADLALWAQHIGLIGQAERQQLTQAGESDPAQAEAVLAKAIELREALYRIFSAVAAGRKAATADLALLNGALPAALGHLQLAESNGGFSWTYSGTDAAPDWVLWPVVRSAAELLTSDQLERVKECEDDRGCGFLFLDTSKNRSRRWCNMESCGNRAKVRRHRRRQAEPEAT